MNYGPEQEEINAEAEFDQWQEQWCKQPVRLRDMAARLKPRVKDPGAVGSVSFNRKSQHQIIDIADRLGLHPGDVVRMCVSFMAPVFLEADTEEAAIENIGRLRWWGEQ